MATSHKLGLVPAIFLAIKNKMAVDGVVARRGLNALPEILKGVVVI